MSSAHRPLPPHLRCRRSIVLQSPTLRLEWRFTGNPSSPGSHLRCWSGTLRTSLVDYSMALAAQDRASRATAGRGRVPGQQGVPFFAPISLSTCSTPAFPPNSKHPAHLRNKECGDGTETVSYSTPTIVFGSSRNRELDALSAERDPLYGRIVKEVVKAP